MRTQLQEKLSNDYKVIFNYCIQTYKDNSAIDISERITKLGSYLALTSSMLAEAQFVYDEIQSKLLNDFADLDLSPNTLKRKVDADSRNEKLLYTKIERLNACIVHQLDALRSQLSYIKIDMANSYK